MTSLQWLPASAKLCLGIIRSGANSSSYTGVGCHYYILLLEANEGSLPHVGELTDPAAHGGVEGAGAGSETRGCCFPFLRDRLAASAFRINPSQQCEKQVVFFAVSEVEMKV